MNRFVCIHGHFYQPPRENPWLEAIELQESAYPYHDWNERITLECYSPNTASRILDHGNKIIEIVNNYSRINFNFGPTLLSWLEKYEPEVYQAILDADKESLHRFSGHGAALAQCYNHMIMPLSNDRDKLTQVIWGIADFEYRFKRKTEGMWLPETAVDIATLEVMADHGIKFSILAPHQAAAVKKINEKKWEVVDGSKIDPRRPYLCHLPSGRSINLFFYDGPIARDIAFGDLLKNGENFAKRLLSVFSPNEKESQIVHIATDGETYGHHHRYGEMALSYCLQYIEKNKLARITVYGEYLAKHLPTYEVRIHEDTSWSCAHGVERWREDCGCNSGGNPGWEQKWRAPLRQALDGVRDSLAPVYEKGMSAFTTNPWQVRDKYIDVILDRSKDNVERFLAQNCSSQMSPEDKIKCLKLLEMQRNAMLMYTSCGWFFDEISGIESMQVLEYASRAIQLARDVDGSDLERNFMKILEEAPSNLSVFKNGADVYEKNVRPAVTDLLRVGSHYAMSSLFEDYPKTSDIYCYTITDIAHEQLELEKQKMAFGRASIRSNITWEEDVFHYAVIHLGSHNIVGGVDRLLDEKTAVRIHQEIKEAFKKNDDHLAPQLIARYFEHGQYSLWHLFKDEQSNILYKVLRVTLEEVETSLRQINEYHSSIIQVIKQLHIPLPKVLAYTVVMMINKDFLDVLSSDSPNLKRLQELVSEVKEWSLEIDKVSLSFFLRRKINEMMAGLEVKPEEIGLLKNIEALLRVLHPLSLDLDLWNAQNIYYAMGKKIYLDKKHKADQGEETAIVWIEYFNRLGEYLKVSVAR